MRPCSATRTIRKYMFNTMELRALVVLSQFGGGSTTYPDTSSAALIDKRRSVSAENRCYARSMIIILAWVLSPQHGGRESASRVAQKATALRATPGHLYWTSADGIHELAQFHIRLYIYCYGVRLKPLCSLLDHIACTLGRMKYNSHISTLIAVA